MYDDCHGQQISIVFRLYLMAEFVDGLICCPKCAKMHPRRRIQGATIDHYCDFTSCQCLLRIHLYNTQLLFSHPHRSLGPLRLRSSFQSRAFGFGASVRGSLQGRPKQQASLKEPLKHQRQQTIPYPSYAQVWTTCFLGTITKVTQKLSSLLPAT